MLSPILHAASGLWILGKIEDHVAKPLSSSEIDGVIAREIALRAEIAELTKDKERLDWLEAHPQRSHISGGSDDGATGTFWGCGSYNCTLRETIDQISADKT